MGGIMTGAAFRILFMDALIVRQSVAFLTSRYQSVLRMALGTGQGRMFGLFGCQLLVRNGMAATADLFVLVYGIGDLQRCMDRMTGQAVSGPHLDGRAV